MQDLFFWCFFKLAILADTSQYAVQCEEFYNFKFSFFCDFCKSDGFVRFFRKFGFLIEVNNVLRL